MTPPWSSSTDFAAFTPRPSAARWLAALRLRPLVWLTPAAALGGATGLDFGARLFADGATRNAAAALWPLLPALAFFLMAWRWRHLAFLSRFAFFCGVACFSAAHGARRALPPDGDLSRVPVQEALRSRMAPLQAVTLTLRGVLADHPQRGDRQQEFPLQTARGLIWVSAPQGLALRAGDEIEIAASVRALPRAGNPAQRESAWRYIGAGCWCITKLKENDVRFLRSGAAFPVARFVGALRGRITAHYENAFVGDSPDNAARPYPRATAQLLTAMVFGQGGLQEALPRRTQDNFRAAGMTHLLVASGQQVTLFAMVLLGLTRAVGLRRGWLLLLVLPPLLLYALITGGAASIWRATIGGVCLAWALLLGRDVDALSLWSLAFIALFVIEPASLTDLSFQLTFAATWGLIALAPVLRRLLEARFGSGPLTDVAALTLGAQSAVLPLMLLHFGNASWAGMGFNLLAVPLCGVLVTTGVAGLFLPLASSVNYPLTRFVDELAATAARAPGALVETSPLPLGTMLLLCALLLAVAASPVLWNGENAGEIVSQLREAARDWKTQRQRQYAKRGGAPRVPQMLAIALLLFTVWAAAREWRLRHAPLRVTMLDVGQGEAIVIQAPSGRTVLIDGGSGDERGDVGRGIIVPYLRYIGARRVDVLVLTHSDSDHCNGLSSVIEEVPIGLALDGAAQPGDPLAADYQSTKAALRRRAVPIVAARAGQRIDLDDGAVLTVLSPLWPPLRESPDNNNAAVLRLDFGETNFLFTADIESLAEARLVQRGAALRCTILKVAHHGSGGSSSAAFLRAAQPRAALVSCGRYNRFRHPAPSTMQSLARRGAAIFRTDLNGAIEVSSDGRACTIQTYR